MSCRWGGTGGIAIRVVRIAGKRAGYTKTEMRADIRRVAYMLAKKGTVNRVADIGVISANIQARVTCGGETVGVERAINVNTGSTFML